MHIHTVKNGDTVFKIAREYSTSPMKIIENNELSNPDRLTPGQKLLILTPTRTYTVRGSDTLRRIADRFGVKYNSLLAKNPFLAGTDKIYPGQLISVKYDAPRYGMACANGYYYKGTPLDRLTLVMPYLTYITVAAGKRDGNNGVKLLFDDTEIIEAANQNGKTPLLRVYDDSKDFSDSYIDNLILMAKTHGYGGITLAAYTAMKETSAEYANFLMKLKKELMGHDLLLFAEMDANREPTLPDICDGYVLMYEKCHYEDIPAFSDGERKMAENFASASEPSKAYIDIPAYGYMGDEEITVSDAEKLAYSSGQEIKYDDEKKISYFHYNKYRNGKKESVRVAYDALENIKAKLSLVGEFGFMGICFDIMYIPTSYLMLFETMFNRPVI